MQSKISASQSAQNTSRPEDVWMTADRPYTDQTGGIWIPAVSEDKTLRFFVIAYRSTGGQRAVSTAKDASKKKFVWSTLLSDVETFVRSHIHYLLSVGGGRVPHRYVLSVQEIVPNDLPQFDCFAILTAVTGEK